MADLKVRTTSASGISRFFRHAHPRGVGMQVGARDLTLWSFLMASAHGAGLMVLPLVIGGVAMPNCMMHTSQTVALSVAWAIALVATSIAMMLTA